MGRSHLGDRLDRASFDPVFSDRFSGSAPDPGRWVDHYLPQWTTPERSKARYAVDAGGLQLLVEADQPAWRAEDGPMRVSNLQTGTFSGPLGSAAGQHRHRPDLVVRSRQRTRRLWTPSAGLVEATVRASGDPTCMLGIWLVGFEEASPQESGEICVAELFGDAISPGCSRVRLGIKAHHDPRLRDDVADVTLALDATEEHTYAAAWTRHATRFFVDDRLVREVPQGTDYPLQLMLGLFEFPTDGPRRAADYPKSARVRAVRGHVHRA